MLPALMIYIGAAALTSADYIFGDVRLMRAPLYRRQPAGLRRRFRGRSFIHMT